MIRSHPERWDMFSKIANTPHLARYVEYVEVVNTTMLWVHPFHKWEFYFFRGLPEMPPKVETLVAKAQPRLGIGTTFAQSAELGVVFSMMLTHYMTRRELMDNIATGSTVKIRFGE